MDARKLMVLAGRRSPVDQEVLNVPERWGILLEVYEVSKEIGGWA